MCVCVCWLADSYFNIMFLGKADTLRCPFFFPEPSLVIKLNLFFNLIYPLWIMRICFVCVKARTHITEQLPLQSDNQEVQSGTGISGMWKAVMCYSFRPSCWKKNNLSSAIHSWRSQSNKKQEVYSGLTGLELHPSSYWFPPAGDKPVSYVNRKG